MLKEQILKLRELGYTYAQIQEELGCSKGTISYHLNPEVKAKSKVQSKAYKEDNTLKTKLYFFLSRGKSRTSFKVKVNDFHRRDNSVKRHSKGSLKDVQKEFTIQDVIDKFEQNPTCYLTGRKLDVNDSSTYSFDHITPAAKGGDNSLENLGFTTKEANQMKSDLTLEELLNMCEEILRHHKRI